MCLLWFTYGTAGQSQTPLMTPHMHHTSMAPPGSAVFKVNISPSDLCTDQVLVCSVCTMLCVPPQTFPGDKENRVHFLLPSATPSPVHVTPHKDRSPHRGGEGSGTLQEKRVGGRGGGGGGGGGKQRSPPKRKVLR